MRKAYERLIAVLQAYSAVLMIAMLLVVLLGVVFRYIINEALSWYDEFAEFILVWLTMYGSVVALARGKHIGFETLKERLPFRWQRGTDIFALLCILGFSVVLLGWGWILVRSMAAETAVSIPEVKMSWIYSVLPITGGLMVLVCVVRLIALFGRGRASSIPRAKGMEEGQ
jgi:TRAP-type C4-dicarboxylate transport system permease small subunit